MKKKNTGDIPHSCRAFIDIHCHVLPNIDDGPCKIKETIQMLKMASMEGVIATIATPHLILDSNTEHTIRLAKRRAKAVKRRITKKGINTKLFLGYEIMASERTIYYGDLKHITLAKSKWLLVETQNSDPLHWMDDLLLEARLQGLGVIIAHPERYHWFAEKPDRLQYLVEKGALLQLNAQSITGASGFAIRHRAKKYCKNGWVSFVATDAHAFSGRRRFCIKEAVQTLLTWLPEDQVKKLIRKNAEKFIISASK